MFRMPISCYETDDYGWIKQQKVHIHHSALSSTAVGNGYESSGKNLLYYTKNQLDATLAVLIISNCKSTLHVSGAFCAHLQEYTQLH